MFGAEVFAAMAIMNAHQNMYDANWDVWRDEIEWKARYLDPFSNAVSTAPVMGQPNFQELVPMRVDPKTTEDPMLTALMTLLEEDRNGQTS
jgi:hypothetical protein